MRIGIIGGGLTSLALAKALVNQNIYVDILTDKNKQKIDQSRTIGITKSNVEYFNKNIININKIIWKLNKIEIFSEKLSKEKLLEFKNNSQELFSMVRSLDLYNILEKNLRSSKFFKKKNESNLVNAQNKYNLRQICGINGHQTVISIDETGSISEIKQALGGDLGTLTLNLRR